MCRYGVASVSRIDKIIGLLCKRALYKRRYSAKETYNFIDPTDRSYPIVRVFVDFYGCIYVYVCMDSNILYVCMDVYIFKCV